MMRSGGLASVRESREVQPGEPIGIAECVYGDDPAFGDGEGHDRHHAAVGGDDHARAASVAYCTTRRPASTYNPNALLG